MFGFVAATSALFLLPAYQVAGQSVPSHLPQNWTSQGCFTDISTSRTLAALFIANSSMTIENCIATCGSAGYIFAGTEFGHCDSTIQIPGAQAALSDCNMGCAGNGSESCGGSNRLNVFFSGGQSPQIVQSVAGGTWTYQGCFTDSTSTRTLSVPVNIPGGVTAESCTGACQALNGFVKAGLETGHECWCSNTTLSTAQRVSDDDCRQVCDANHNEYCGNADRIAIYEVSTAGNSTGPTECLATDVANFTLRAAFRSPQSLGPSTVPLKVITAELAGGTQWTIISACPNCCSEWPSFSLQNSIVFPQSIVVPGQLMSSTAPNDGESPNFVASNPAFPGFQAYCTVTDTSSAAGSPSLLALGGKADAFSLCKNQTVNDRLDLVFSPVTGHPHYSLSDCSPVNVQVIQG